MSFEKQKEGWRGALSDLEEEEETPPRPNQYKWNRADGGGETDSTLALTHDR